MTSREIAFKAIGFLRGFSANVWQDYDAGVAESYDRAIKDIERYVENSIGYAHQQFDPSMSPLVVKPDNPMGGWITTCECTKADSLDGALS